MRGRCVIAVDGDDYDIAEMGAAWPTTTIGGRRLYWRYDFRTYGRLLHA